MSAMHFDKATGKERENLALLRAGAWSGEATSEQFTERNRRVYRHPYGIEKISTYILRDDKGTVVSSMDALSIVMLVNREKTESPVREEGFLIASVITPPEYRKKGYASLLLKNYFDIEKRNCGVLYSDVGPEFYERFDFHENLGWVVQKKAVGAALSFSGCPMEIEEFCNSLNRYRTKQLISKRAGAGCLAADKLFLDWQLVRFRYFSEIKSKQLPEQLCFKVIHGNSAHDLFMIPNELSKKAEVFWREPACKECLSFISAKAYEWGMAHFVYWDFLPDPDAVKQECPMIRISNSNAPHFSDPQLCDWW